MKDFLKYTLATITGIIILSVIMGIMSIISLIGIAASEAGGTPVKSNSVFVLSLNGVVEERSSDDFNPMAMLMGGSDMEQMGLDDMVSAIRKAKENDDIKGIYIEAGTVEFDSYATVQQLRKELADFKKSGKWIVAYGDMYTQSAYWLASVADKVYLNHNGEIDLKGLGMKAEYHKGLFDKLGITFQATRVGKYKSYVEQNTRTSMSDEDREQRTAYLQGVWKQMLADMAGSRKINADALNNMVNDSIIALANQKDYVKGKLIDGVLFPEEIKAEIKKRLQLDEKKDIPQMTLKEMTGVNTKKKDKGDKVSIYYACGEITDKDLSGFTGETGIVGSEMAADLRKLADDDKVKAVVIRVSSPGGSATASEQIWHAVKLLKQKKPVVVSMGGVAASGGYMISAAANYIFAEPTTITGSIGIFGMFPNLSGLVTDKLGVTFDDVTTNKYTNYMENVLLSKNNAAELAFMQTYVNRGYEDFLGIVADGRKMTKEQVNEIAQGRVWLATDAKGIKLVDELGSLDQAVAKAAKLAKLDEYHAVVFENQKSWFEKFLPSTDNGNYLDAQIKNIMGDYYQEWVFLRTINKRSKLQARLPFSTRVH